MPTTGAERSRRYYEKHTDRARSASASWARKNPHKGREKTKRYAEKYPERVREASRRYYRKHKDKRRARQLKKDYGISTAEWAVLYGLQAGRCAICGGVDNDRSLAVDHCHRSEKIRGLLCLVCNMTLGRFNDNPALLEKAAAYLRRHDGTPEQA